MKYQPHGYQQRAGRWLAQRGSAMLALEMGLGKSVVAATVAAQWLDECEVACVLVIAPKKVAEDTWPRELAKWDHLRHLRVSMILGTAKQREAAVAASADVYVVNRENVVWLFKHCGKSWPFDCVIVDESTSFKSASAKRWRALKRVRPRVRRMVLLTGTPAPNDYLDLWAQLYLIDGGQRLGRTFGDYRDHYFTADYMGYNWNERPGAREDIQQRIADVVLTMRAEDWLTLPALTVVDVPVSLPPAAMRAYQGLERKLVLNLPDKQITAATAAAVLNKLLQCANGAVYDELGAWHALHDAKLEMLADLIEGAGSPVMVVYAYRSDLARIRERFPEAQTPDGPDVIARWNRREVPLLLVHPASAGYGLNLQDGGHHVVWFGLTWSLEQYAQTNARLHRQGQQRPVMVHRLIGAGTADERVAATLAGKADVLAELMEKLR